MHPRLRDDVVVWLVAKERNLPETKKLAERAPFNQTLLQWCIVFGRLGEWKVVTPQLKHLAQALFAGFAQSKVNEDANKMYRDAEVRGNASKVIKMMRLWEIPTMQKLLSQYKRPEIDPQSQAPAPPPAAMEKCFSMPPSVRPPERGMSEKQLERMALRNEWSQKLKAVLGPQQWLTFDAESQHHLFSELELLRRLHSAGEWHLAAEVWRSRLVPAGQFLVDEQGGQVWLVVKSFSHGFVCWPASQVFEGTWAPDTQVRQLVWKFCSDFDGPLKILPTQVCSPLRSWLAHSQPCGIVSRATGDPMPIRKWLCANGFPSAPEWLPKKFLEDEMGQKVPDHAGSGDYRAELAMLCIKAVEPTASVETVVKSLRKAHSIENGEHSNMMMVDEVMMRDVLVQTEAVEMRLYLKSLSVAKARLDMHVCKVDERVHAHFKAGRSSKTAAGNKSQTAAPRWLPGKLDETAGATAWILKHRPNCAAIEEDSYNGQWRLHYPGRPSRSISWTQRGHEVAAKLSVWHLWTAHREASGAEPPFAIEPLWSA